MATDLYFDKVSLLLHLNGANGSTTITDSSPNPKTVTAQNGAAISTAQSKFGGSSGYFDGNDNVLEVPAHADHLFGTDDFTWECWAYFASGSGNQTLISLGINRTLYRASNGYLYYYEPDIGNNVIGAVCPTSQWVHCALTRRAGVLYIFVNGALGGSAAYTKNLTESDIWIGKYRNVSSPLNGYIDEVRITKGHGRYISNFTAPVEAFPDSGPPPEVEPAFDPIYHKVSLLLHCNGADGSTTYLDSSSTPKTVTPALSAQISTAQSKFGGASARFTSGDYMTVPETSSFGFGVGDFTIEMWVRPALTGDSTQVFIDFRPSDSGVPLLIGCTSAGAVRYYDGSTVRTGGLMAANTWHHVAWCRASNVNTIYLNGLVVSTYTAAQDFGASKGLCIGVNVIKWAEKFVGNLDEIRITRGTARYTSEFIPTNFPFPNNGPVEIEQTSDPYWDRVSLLVKFNGANNSTEFPDLGPRKLPYTLIGSPKISTAQSKFGGASGVFASGDAISYEGGPWFTFGTVDFTLEGWSYFMSGTPFSTCISLWENMTVYRNSSNGTLNLYNKATEANLVSGPCPLDIWVHWAVTRRSGVFYLWINGDLVSSHSSYVLDVRGSNCQIGINVDSSAPHVGYLDEIRVTKGVARYTESFVPSVFPLPVGPSTSQPTYDPDYDKVVLLLDEHGDGWSTDFRDTSRYARAPQVAYTPKVSRGIVRGGQSGMYFDGTGGLTFGYAKSLMLTADFTIELWFQPSTTSGGMLLNLGGGSGIAWASYELLWNGSSLYFAASATNTGYEIGAESGSAGLIGSSLSAGTWYHVAVTCQGNVYRGFLNGVQTWTQTIAAHPRDSRTRGLAVGHNYSTQWNTPGFQANGFTGYMDGLRITNGLARYTSDFIPPTGPLPPYFGFLAGKARDSLGALTSVRGAVVREADFSSLGEFVSDAVTGEFVVPTKFVDEHTLVFYPSSSETRSLPAKIYRGVLPIAAT